MRRKVSRPDFSFDHGFGLRNRSDSVPCDRHKTRCANIACGMLYRFSSALILWANSFVFISSTSLLIDVTDGQTRNICVILMVLFFRYKSEKQVNRTRIYIHHFVAAMIAPDFVLAVYYSIGLYCL